MQHPWKHSVTDVYANNYGNIIQDYFSLVVEPSLQALQQRSAELMALPDDGLFTKPFLIVDHAALQQKTAMAFCLGIQSLWEQHLRLYVTSCLRQFFTPAVPDNQFAAEIAKKIELAEKATWGSRFNAFFLEARGLELHSFPSYAQIDLLMALGNICRHGEGDAARRLRKSHPELWPEQLPILEEHFGNRPITDLKLSIELLRSFVIAIVLFWRDLERHGLKSFMHDKSDTEINTFLSNRMRV